MSEAMIDFLSVLLVGLLPKYVYSGYAHSSFTVKYTNFLNFDLYMLNELM